MPDQECGDIIFQVSFAEFHVLQPENLLAVEMEGYTVPEIKLIHFERSKEVTADSDVIIRRLDDHIEYEGMCVCMVGDVYQLSN